MPYAGRGGAGNIQVVQQENERVSADLEANRAEAESQSQPAPPREEPQYAHHGRGGAGNWHSPREMSETGLYKDNNLSQIIGDGVSTLGNAPIDNPSTQSRNLVDRVAGPVRFAGRGGSGNYVFDASETQERALRQRLEEEDQKKAQLREQVEKGVKETLAMPPKAKLSGAQQYD